MFYYRAMFLPGHRKTIAVWGLTILFAFFNISDAIQVGKTIEYSGSQMGKVIFDGKMHNDAGYHCMKCHNKIFPAKIGTAKILYSHHTGRKEYCFACHNGSDAFDASGSCYRCHKR